MRHVVRLPLAAGLLVAASLATAGPAAADGVRNAQWYLKPLGVEQAWQTTRGKGVAACVVDSGVDPDVPDLGPGVLTKSKIFTPYVNDAGVQVDHGTGVAVVLAGRGHGAGHGSGVIGVAPQATLLSATIATTAPDTDQQVADGVRWCADNGARVINMSFALPTDPQGRITGAVRYARNKDAVVVAAAGNTFEPIPKNALSYPARLPGVVAVTGVNSTLEHDGGAITSSTGKPVTLSAPNTNTDGTSGSPRVGLPTAGDRYDVAKGQTYNLHGDGTSYSSPIVAGTVALMRAVAPHLTADRIIDLLLRSATPAGAGHPNRTYGYGIVDVARAVAAADAAAHPSASTAPHSASAATTAPSTPVPSTTVPPAAATATDAVSDSSHAGAWIGVGAAAVVVAGLLALLLRRRRNTH